MTISTRDGPEATIGVQPPLGTVASASIYGAPYVSGVNENPDAGPNVYFAGSMFRDMRIRAEPDGRGITAGGYANQHFGYMNNQLLTIDMVPSAILTNNISVAAALVASTPVTLAAGTGTSILAAAFTVPGTRNVIPAGALQIDAAPTYHAFGTSGAIGGWDGTACGRAISLTAASGAQVVALTVSGWDVYGFPITQTLNGPNTGATVNTLKGFKWIKSITPGVSVGTGTMAVGTADIFELPMRADVFADTSVYWNDTAITANTGFVAGSQTNPNTAALGSTRGTYAVQSASDGTKRLRVYQRIRPANAETVVGCYGVTMV